jgi:hypothetical protein
MRGGEWTCSEWETRKSVFAGLRRASRDALASFSLLLSLFHVDLSRLTVHHNTCSESLEFLALTGSEFRQRTMASLDKGNYWKKKIRLKTM